MATGTKAQKKKSTKKPQTKAISMVVTHKVPKFADVLLEMRTQELVNDLGMLEEELNTTNAKEILKKQARYEALRKELRTVVEQPNTNPLTPIVISTPDYMCVLSGRQLKRYVGNLQEIHRRLGDKFYTTVAMTIEECEKQLKSDAPLFIVSTQEGIRKIEIKKLSQAA